MKKWVAAGSGALALLALAAVAAVLAGVGGASNGGHVVEVWVAAVPVRWNVVPNERDAVGHMEFSPSETVFRTVAYRQFTKDWAEPVPQAQPGLQGPLIRAEVGDTILVHFENLDDMTNHAHSMHFHGVHYAPGSDGAYIPGFSGPGAVVKPGETFTYKLLAGDDSAGVWPYHDHSTSMDESVMGGLYGALSIRPKGEALPDRENVVFFGTQLGFMTIDGHAFVGNTPVFHAKVGDTVQWDVLNLGDDFHTFHVHGHRWLDPSGVSEDVQTVGPAESFRIRWTEDAAGVWYYHCHVESHMMNGMIGIYVVAQR